jgi:release factor glutamine methyltransferase
MKSKECRSQFIEKLTPIYGEAEAESFFYLILEDRHQLRRIDLALHPEMAFNSGDLQYWNQLLEQLLLEIPIQYLLGKTSFYGLEFEVTNHVLIPRPETEELVDWIIQDNFNNNSNEDLRILDIGTGSGCIAISLAKNLSQSKVFAIDVSKEALVIAKKNALLNGADVSFVLQDILEIENLNQKFDIIVSNPPYVRNLEKHEIKNNVLNNEPHLALFVEDEDALIFYKKIAEIAQNNLNPNGQLFFEINQYLAKETVELLSNRNFKNILLRQDIYGNDRMIKCTF